MADPKQIERLSKLRRLARGNPSREEGATAQAKLAELMQKHGVTVRDLDVFDQAQGRPAAPPPPPPNPFQGGFVVEIVPGAAFGQVFGFGFGFSVHLGPSTGASGSSTTSSGW